MIPEQPIDTRFPGQQFPVGRVSRSSTATGAPSSPPSPSCGATKPSSPAARPAGGACATPGSGSSRPAPRAERRCGRSETTPRNCSNATSTRTRWRPGGRFRFETATGRAGICRHDARTIALSVSFVLRASWGDIRDTLLHEIAHAIVGPGHAHDAVWRTAARRIGCTAKRCSTVTHSLKRWNRGVPEVPGPVFRHHLTARVRQRSICPRRGSPVAWRINAHGKAADRGNARTGLPRLPVRSDDRPDGHRHRQTTVRGPASPPRAGGSFGPPSHPSRRHNQGEPRTTGGEHVGATRDSNDVDLTVAATANPGRRRRLLAMIERGTWRGQTNGGVA